MEDSTKSAMAVTQNAGTPAFTKVTQYSDENPSPVLRVDPVGTILYTNPASTPLLNFWNCEPRHALPEAILGHVTASLRQEASQQIEVSLPGRVLSLVFAPDAEGRYVNIYGHDITARKRAEEALQDSERTTRMLIEAAPVGLVIVDEKGTIVLINRVATQLFGYDPMELIGQPLTLLVPEMHRERHLEQCAHYFTTPYIRPMGAGLDLWARRKDGMAFPVEISLGAVETQQGRLALAFIVDITKRHEVEQLREAMVHTMVHDLRSPLGNIMTALQIIQMDTPDLDAEKQQLLAIALHGGEKLLALINAILDVSRLESGKMPLERSHVGLSDLVNDTLETLAPQAKSKQIALNLEVPPTLPPVWVDMQLIGRVFQNLVGNALKFTPEGGAVTISARQEGEKVLATVSDTGPGIAPEIRNRLFQKFVTGKIAGRGSGLGLAFCKLVLETHGEQISAESEVGRGTTFTFSLPVSEL